MAWIKVISPGDSQDELLTQYDRMKDPTGNVANILAVHSLKPAALRTHFDFYKTLMFGQSELSRAQREMIALLNPAPCGGSPQGIEERPPRTGHCFRLHARTYF